MSPATHFLVSWVVASAGGLSRRERAAVTVAGIAADADALGLIAEELTRGWDRPLLWWTDYHHVLAHNLAFGLTVAGVTFLLAQQRWKTSALALLVGLMLLPRFPAAPAMLAAAVGAGVWAGLVQAPQEMALGWPALAPYDAIMVTAGAPEMPGELLAQLAVGGCMVIPVGSRYVQELYRVSKSKKRNVIEKLGGCHFVSLIGKGAWEDN